MLFMRSSGLDPAGVPGEEGSVADIAQSAVQHHDPLEPEPRPPVRECAVPERVDVVRQGLHSNAALGGPLFEHLGVVDPLGAGGDLLAPHENVVGVRVAWFLGAQHRVEGAGFDRVLVQDVEIGVELVLD
jgi:hypothetical protein